jgi:hypothetical protein
LTGDFTGDGKADILAQSPVDGSWPVARSTGSAFVEAKQWLGFPWAAATHYKLFADDFTGDGKDDVLVQNPMDGEWAVAVSNGSAFVGASNWLKPWAASDHYRILTGDFTGDGKADILAQSPVDGEWAVARSTGSAFVEASSWLRPWAASTHYKLMP